MPKEISQEYKWVFSHKGRGFQTTFGANGHGDMNIYQIRPWAIRSRTKEKGAIFAAASFQQHTERGFFMHLLRYAQEHCKNLKPFEEKSGLLSKINELPDRGGNFTEVHEEDAKFREDLIYIRPGFKLEGAPLGTDERVEIDTEGNFLLIPEYFDGKDGPPVIFPPDQIPRALYGLIYLASYGIVRTSKKALTDRLDYWRENILQRT